MASPIGRIAPTPSGYLHRGNLLNFLINRELVGPTGKLLLRIDDLDQGRYRKAYVEDIFSCLEWLGIEWALSWHQETRLERYRGVLESIRTHSALYACPCSRKEISTTGHREACRERKIPLDAPNTAWKIAVAAGTTVEIPDRYRPEPFRVAVTDYTVRRKDGRPSYQLACTVDDSDYGVNTVARGRDLLESTAVQAHLSGVLGMPPLLSRVRFFHHALLTDASGEKLSKSAGNSGSPRPLTTATKKELYRELRRIIPESRPPSVPRG